MYLIQQNIFYQMSVILNPDHWIKVDSNKKNSLFHQKMCLIWVICVSESFKVKKWDSSETADLVSYSFIGNCCNSYFNLLP